MVFEVTENYDGKLLRDFLRIGCKVSRKALCGLKACENGIMLNGKSVTVRATVHTGDEVAIKIEDCEQDENPYVFAIGSMPPIVYEDEAVLVVSKPAGMPTHTSFGHYDDALSNAVCAYLKSKGQPFVFRAVNRLDADTSGLVLIAKNKYYSSILSKSLENGEFEKTYIAVTDGYLTGNGSIKGYIAREGESIIKRRFSPEPIENGEYSHTEYEVLCSNNEASVLKVTPITGRTHQLRVHLSSLGASIIGDSMYGSKSDLIARQALHAYSLTFPSPLTRNKMTVYATLPDDIRLVLKACSLELTEENT